MNLYTIQIKYVTQILLIITHLVKHVPYIDILDSRNSKGNK